METREELCMYVDDFTDQVRLTSGNPLACFLRQVVDPGRMGCLSSCPWGRAGVSSGRYGITLLRSNGVG